ncbi:sulfur oxidation c-type cytochrome SoxX [Polynucleobacter sp. UB-Tiil-W10]|uniref:sulfur oxidation c-type cytochrome SoxX n=1 Tax=Polynucleobacter sp. UB-Tiil-W10 TaxID=1855648 RepID=UPI001C0BF233|nr:sulfur oxidation c-type cytochrome SoxX [Polynucleobacter sp. UB-Tiil-W10]MBU3539685.1 sulfur oxidation c-type cytochrome SoxX [Polynucleobacter sp. UB-Tiil-W10]
MKKGIALAFLLLGILNFSTANAQAITGDSIFESLSTNPGDPVRGRAIVASRQTGLCLLCHSGPFPEERFQGSLAPELKASAARLNAPQLRARIVNAAYFNPQTIMPAYYQTSNLNRVAPKFAGQTILNGQEIEDVVAFLMTLNNSN